MCVVRSISAMAWSRTRPESLSSRDDQSRQRRSNVRNVYPSYWQACALRVGEVVKENLEILRVEEPPELIKVRVSDDPTAFSIRNSHVIRVFGGVSGVSERSRLLGGGRRTLRQSVSPDARTRCSDCHGGTEASISRTKYSHLNNRHNRPIKTTAINQARWTT
jgi:hypothetical protein